ncbi:hypothetical protein MTR67_039535 [Solanum verrucosum]|uniref:Uncharacterized protein n=1 Tax=Solanum verrucosum TaxID=315347 RepID=A0AAF0UH28_SOLVR|nr:hypothetical protein MTR67_039535 [Solanum verrucosum]
MLDLIEDSSSIFQNSHIP